METDEYLYRVGRYIERNPLRANLVSRAEDWRWSSLWRRIHGDGEPGPLLSPWPVRLPADWVEQVNAPLSEADLAALRRSVRRGCPFGSVVWQEQMAVRQGLLHTLRPLGRPRKPAIAEPAALSEDDAQP